MEQPITPECQPYKYTLFSGVDIAKLLDPSCNKYCDMIGQELFPI